jgi:hypothetical protein
MRSHVIFGGFVILSLAYFGLAPLDAQVPPSISPRAAKVKSHLAAILAGSEYRQSSPKESLLTTLGKWFTEKLSALSRWLGQLLPRVEPHGTSQWLLWILSGVLLLGMAYLMAYTLQHITLWKHSRPTKKPTIEQPVVDIAEEKISLTEPEAYLEVARRHAASGDLHRAYRYAFLALLLRMDRIGAIHFDPARTNGEYLRILRNRPALYTLWKPLAHNFDARWYGSMPITTADYEHCLSAYEQIVPASTSMGG